MLQAHLPDFGPWIRKFRGVERARPAKSEFTGKFLVGRALESADRVNESVPGRDRDSCPGRNIFQALPIRRLSLGERHQQRQGDESRNDPQFWHTDMLEAARSGELSACDTFGNVTRTRAAY